jgi:hypothetical protein
LTLPDAANGPLQPLYADRERVWQKIESVITARNRKISEIQNLEASRNSVGKVLKGSHKSEKYGWKISTPNDNDSAQQEGLTKEELDSLEEYLRSSVTAVDMCRQKMRSVHDKIDRLLSVREEAKNFRQALVKALVYVAFLFIFSSFLAVFCVFRPFSDRLPVYDLFSSIINFS